MFTLSSADVNIPKKIDQEINIPIQIITSTDKIPKEKITHDVTASCDIDGQIFVYESDPPQHIDQPTGLPFNFAISNTQYFFFFYRNVTPENRTNSTMVIKL